ncbi:MAG: 4a-hydroxytetrahydrobiopterin dehydratase, partial [Actinobacteria bacterium]|nr:4a-hydroxytetrahydrobiopterin dehydratase [Actinomycetota bacterium]
MHHSRLPHSLPRMSGAPEGWHHADGKLHREFEFKDFAEAFGFMTMVAMLA